MNDKRIKCLKHEYTDIDPIRLNIEFFIGLRNTIEHRFQAAFLAETAQHAHVINFESELVKRFGAEHSLAHELRFPVFVQSLTPAAVADHAKARKGLPAAARNFITTFEAGLDPAVLASEQFIYRVELKPVKGPKTEADMAVTFVRQDDLTREELEQLRKEGKAGTVYVSEKQREVGLLDHMLPGQAAKLVEEQIPFEFGTNHFWRTWKYNKVRPAKGSEHPERTVAHYCVYAAPQRQYVYSPAYVQLLTEQLSTEEGFWEVVGSRPIRKAGWLEDGHDASSPPGASTA